MNIPIIRMASMKCKDSQWDCMVYSPTVSFFLIFVGGFRVATVNIPVPWIPMGKGWKEKTTTINYIGSFVSYRTLRNYTTWKGSKAIATAISLGLS